MNPDKRIFAGETPAEGVPPAAPAAGTPPPAAGAPPPAAPDSMAEVKQMLLQIAQRQAQQEQFISEKLTAPVPQQTADDDDSFVDPGVRKLLEKHGAQVNAALSTVTDHQDFFRFQQHCSSRGYDDKTMMAAEATFQAWRKAGMKIGNDDPSRIDALRYHIGLEADNASVELHKKRLEAQHQTRLENQHAFAPPRGGTRVVHEKDPDKMTEDELLAYLPTVLDTEPW